MHQHVNILMVDDDPDDLLLIEDALRDVGQEVHCEQNGIDALNYLENCSDLPNVIILDLNMPKLNGTETLSILKANTRFKEIPVVIYSTSINALEKERCLHLGAHSYLVKPISYAETLFTARYLNNIIENHHGSSSSHP